MGDGGITSSVRRLSDALVRQGAQAVVVAEPGNGTGLDGDFRWVPLKHVGPGALRVPAQLGRVLAGADVLLLNSAWTAHNVAAGAVARRRGVPYVLAPRGAYDPSLWRRRRAAKRVWWALLERPLVRGARALHVFFDEQRDHLRAMGWRGDVLVAPNGVEVPAGLRWDGGSGGYVLYLGRFDPEHKGLDLLLRGVAAMRASERLAVRLHGPDWRGGKERVGALVDELGLRDHVVVGPPAYGDAKWELFTRAAGFVYPSRWEGFGNALAEAAALGVPTLATPYPLARFLAARGATVVVEPTPTDIAEGLRTLRTPAGAARGRVGAEVAAEHLTWDAVARTWLSQLRALL